MSTPSNSFDTSPLIERVNSTLTNEIGPALDMNGSSIDVIDVVDGIARLRIRNVCNG